MTRKKRPVRPLREPDDSPRMIAAIDWAESEGLPIVRKSPLHLKIGDLNFYPDRGSFYEEGSKAGRARGLAAFKIAVAAWLERERRDFR